MATSRKPSSEKAETKPKSRPTTKKSKAAEQAAAPAIDAAAVSAMMEQMQALMAEVTELRKEVADKRAEASQPEAEKEAESNLAKRFLQVLEEGDDEDYGAEEVSSEETASILQAVGQALESTEESEDGVETGLEENAVAVDEPVVELEPAVEEVAEVADDGDGDGDGDLTNENIAALLADAEAEADRLKAEGRYYEDFFDSEEDETPAEPEPKTNAVSGREDEGLAVESQGDMSDEEISALLAEAQLAPETDEAEDLESPVAEAQDLPEPVEEVASGGIAVDGDGTEAVSEEEIAALLAEAQSEPDEVGNEALQMVGAAPVESSVTTDDENSMMSDADIAALLAEAEAGAGSDDEEPDSSATAEADGPDLSEEGLADLVKEEISSQSVPEEVPVKGAGDGGSAKAEDPNDVLSADEIAALLMEPDPEGSAIPESSEAMDDDEIAALLAEANAQEVDGIDTGAHFQKFSEDDDPQEETAEAPIQEPAAAAPAKEPQLQVVDGEPDLGAIKAVPAHLAVRAMAVPVRFQDDKLVCHVAEPIDHAALDKISKATGLGITTVTKPIQEVVAELREVYSEVRDDHARWALKASQDHKPTMMDTVKSVLRRIA